MAIDIEDWEDSGEVFKTKTDEGIGDKKRAEVYAEIFVLKKAHLTKFLGQVPKGWEFDANVMSMIEESSRNTKGNLDLSNELDRFLMEHPNFNVVLTGGTRAVLSLKQLERFAGSLTYEPVKNAPILKKILQAQERMAGVDEAKVKGLRQIYSAFTRTAQLRQSKSNSGNLRPDSTGPFTQSIEPEYRK